MTVPEGVQVQSNTEVGAGKVGPDVKLWEAVVDAKVLDPRGESFLQP